MKRKWEMFCVNASVKEKVRNFDENGRFKVEIDRTMTLLRSFRKKYPFVEKSDLIDSLTTNDISLSTI